MSARQPKPAGQNLSWGGIDKGLNIFKTSLLQKVGRQDRKEVPAEFVQQAERVKQLKKLLLKLIEDGKRYSKTIQVVNMKFGASQLWLIIRTSTEGPANFVLSESNLQYGLTLKEWSDKLPPNDVLAPALAKFNEIQVEIEKYRVEFKEQFYSTIVLYSEKFIAGEITEFKEAKKTWARARLEHDAAKSKLDGLVKQAQTSKPPEPQSLFLAQCHYHLARKKEAQRFELAMDRVGDVLWKRDFDVLQEVVKCITALHDFVLKSYNTLYQLDEYLKQLREHVRQRRADFQALREKRQYERKLKEQEEFANRYSPLVELMSAEDLAIVNAVCVTAGSEQEVILESLISILDAHKMTLPIIKQGISNEVAKTSNAGTLFRGNTMATKLMTAWTRMTGRAYLANTLKPLLDQVTQQIVQGMDFEVDPGKVSAGTVADNMNTLRTTSAQFLQAIVQSFPHCPLPFRVMANHLRNEVMKTFPEAKHTAVGGFIFLRFFCPAILSPDSTSPPLITKVDNNLRRALILISKTLQNLANGLEFGIKEPFMQELNGFIRDNKAYVESFFDQLAAPVESEEYQSLCSRETAIAKELPALHTKIVQNLEKIAKSLSQYKQEETIPILAVLLAELGEEGITVNPDSLKKSKK